MTDAVIFEVPYRGDKWRLEVASHQGRTFANWRKWYPREGDWRPGREGCIFPLECLWDLTEALMRHHGLSVPDGPENRP